MSELEEEEVTKPQRFISNIVAGIAVIVAGLILLLCGLDVIALEVTEILAAVILTAVGSVFLITGFIQKNPVSVWLSFVFLTPALVEFLEKLTSLSYSNLYPLYIAIPAICSVAAMLYLKKFKPFLPSIIFFFSIAALFLLHSTELLPMAVILPVLVVLVGALIILYAYYKKRTEKDDDGKAAKEE